MKKMTFILACLLLIGTTTNATAKGLTTLVISTKDGKDDAVFILSERPEITFANHKLTISVMNDDKVFEINDVEQIYFDVIDDIRSPKTNTISYNYLSDELILIEGIAPNDHIRLYTLGGIQIPNRVNLFDNRAEVSLSSLQKGTYLLKVGNKQTIKIYKK